MRSTSIWFPLSCRRRPPLSGTQAICIMMIPWVLSRLSFQHHAAISSLQLIPPLSRYGFRSTSALVGDCVATSLVVAPSPAITAREQSWTIPVPSDRWSCIPDSTVLQPDDGLHTQIWLARAYYGCRRAMGKIGRFSTTRFYTEIGAGGILKQAGRYPGTYELRTYKFANNSLAKP